MSANADDIGVLERVNCGGCHLNPAAPDGVLTRVVEQRKTPEGWEMTLRRMQMLHRAPFADPSGKANVDEVLASLVKHYADTRGLAPDEAAPFRYILERRLNTIEQSDPELKVMCARCHSAARVGLQRRSEAEWKHLVHFHLAQFPTTEYQAGGRDKDWLGIAQDKIVPMLARTYPLESPAWETWRKAAKPTLAARWRVSGRMPGNGDFEGVMTTKSTGADRYSVALDARFVDGAPLAGEGDAIVYTGYEWRANLVLSDARYLQVLAANTAGDELTGRMFMADHEERGIDLVATRDDGGARLIAAFPTSLQRGASATLTLVGTGLSGKPTLGDGVRVGKVVSRDADRVVVEVVAATDAPIGKRSIAVGKSSLTDALTIFDRVDRIQVLPEYAVGRVGGEGSQPAVQARFDAIAWSNGADGSAGTADDVEIGPVKAAWSVAPWDDKAVEDRDLEFAGAMDKDSGIFTPAAAGPNPARKYTTNNAGNLKVIASWNGSDARIVTGEGHLLVTVQRWNNPPIR